MVCQVSRLVRSTGKSSTIMCCVLVSVDMGGFWLKLDMERWRWVFDKNRQGPIYDRVWVLEAVGGGERRYGYCT